MHLEAGGDVGEVEHDALGLAGGARGVDQGQQIIHPVAAFALAQHQLAWLMVAGDQEGLEVTGLRAAAQIDAAIEGDELADLALIQQDEGLIELLLLAHEQQLDAGVAHYVAQLVQGAGGVDGHADPAGGEDAEVGLGPLRHVASIDADHLGGLVAGPDQGLGAIVHRLSQGAPADGTPLAILLDAQGGLVAKTGNALTHQSNQMKLRHGQSSSSNSCTPVRALKIGLEFKLYHSGLQVCAVCLGSQSRQVGLAQA
ncbi:hypothetical protein D3C79_668170 [compost metagenome]